MLAPPRASSQACFTARPVRTLRGRPRSRNRCALHMGEAVTGSHGALHIRCRRPREGTVQLAHQTRALAPSQRVGLGTPFALRLAEQVPPVTRPQRVSPTATPLRPDRGSPRGSPARLYAYNTYMVASSPLDSVAVALVSTGRSQRRLSRASSLSLLLRPPTAWRIEAPKLKGYGHGSFEARVVLLYLTSWLSSAVLCGGGERSVCRSKSSNRLSWSAFPSTAQ